MSIHPVDIHVGKQLRIRRNQLGISQNELAKSVGVTFQQIQKYERGNNRISSSRLYELANVLNCSVDLFFKGLNKESCDSEVLKEALINDTEWIKVRTDFCNLSLESQKAVRKLIKHLAMSDD